MSWYERLVRPPHPDDVVGAVPPTYQSEYEAAIPSAVDYLDFTVRCTVWWTSHQSMKALAVREVTAYAESLLRQYHPVHWQLAGHRLAADLATPTVLPQLPEVRVHAENVSVTVEETQLELAVQHAHRLRERRHAELEREAERAELHYLRNSVFSDIGTAMLWWLRHNDYDVTRLESCGAMLRELVASAVPDREQDWVGTVIEAFDQAVPSLTRAQRYELHRNLARLLSTVNASEQADTLMSRVESGREIPPA